MHQGCAARLRSRRLQSSDNCFMLHMVQKHVGQQLHSPRAQTCTLEGRFLQKHHQNSTRRPPERENKSENGEGGRVGFQGFSGVFQGFSGVFQGFSWFFTVFQVFFAGGFSFFFSFCLFSQVFSGFFQEREGSGFFQFRSFTGGVQDFQVFQVFAGSFQCVQGGFRVFLCLRSVTRVQTEKRNIPAAQKQHSKELRLHGRGSMGMWSESDLLQVRFGTAEAIVQCHPIWRTVLLIRISKRRHSMPTQWLSVSNNCHFLLK